MHFGKNLGENLRTDGTIQFHPPLPSHPIQAGLCAVPSNCDVVLNGSNRPVIAGCAVFASSFAISPSLIGLNFSTASNACSSRSIDSIR